MGRLKTLVLDGVHEGAFDQDLLKSEEEAKVDIYDYCARYDTTPIFTTTEIQRNRKSIISVTIEMPEQDIVATAKATDRRVADILASVEFKRQAEVWHAKHNEENIVLKDANVLNSRNAKKFFDFYKIHNQHANFQCEVKSIQRRGKRLAASMSEGQIIMNGEPLGDSVEMGGKKNAEACAWVTGAVELKRRYPEIFPLFIEALRIGNGDILKPIQPIWLDLQRDSLVAMTDTLMSVRRIGLPPSEAEMAQDDARAADQMRRSERRRGDRRLDPAALEMKNLSLLEDYNKYLSDPKLVTLRQKRSELPMIQYTDKVLDLVNNNEVSIIVGATGSGKTSKFSPS